MTYITFVGRTHALFQFVHFKITDIFIARRHFLRVIYVLSVYEFNLHGLSLTHIRIKIGVVRMFKINVSLQQISCSHGNVDVIVDFLGCNTVCVDRYQVSLSSTLKVEETYEALKTYLSAMRCGKKNMSVIDVS